MCCDGSGAPELPGPVAEMLVEYRRLAGEDWVWGETSDHGNAKLLSQLRFVPMVELMGHAVRRMQAAHPGAPLQELITLSMATEPDTALRDALGDRRPPGLVVLRLEAGGARLTAQPPITVLAGRVREFSLLVDSDLDLPVELQAGGETRRIAPGGAALVDLSWNGDHGGTVSVDGTAVELGDAFVEREPSALVLRSAQPLRWSVRDPAGGAWFPDGVLRKWDYHQHPYFHGSEVALEVPSGLVEVSARRGLEYGAAIRSVEVGTGSETVVELDPPRRFDPATSGWFGADLHVHMNYGGDLVCTPEDAACMQVGEGLHVLNLVASNCTTSRVFDREALEAWAGVDLPWSFENRLARMGVEYRNDLFGHFHVTGLRSAPSAYHSGHAASETPDDWPPNSVAADCRALGASVGYCHPVLLPIPEDDPSLVFDLMPRSVEAREVVVDAALGLVDSLDVLSNMSGPGAAVLYRHLLGAGVKLAVTAGTDSFLSFSRCSTFSNPPGWARVYADVEGGLTMDRFQEAVRAGRTIATNGPWIELDVDGYGPGAELSTPPGGEVTSRVRLLGPGAETLRLITADGELARCQVSSEEAVLEARFIVSEPTYVVAEAVGGSHPDVLDAQTFAHTSPVYVRCGDRMVARPADARWCLGWIDRFEQLVRREGRFAHPGQLRDLIDVIERARAVYRPVATGG